MKFKDIPQFTSEGDYNVNFPMHRFVKYIEIQQPTMLKHRRW